MIEYKENPAPLIVRLLFFTFAIVFSVYFAIIYNKNGLFFVTFISVFFLVATAHIQSLTIYTDKVIYKKNNIILKIVKEECYPYKDMSFLKINTYCWGVIDIVTGIWPFSELSIIFNVSGKIIEIKMHLSYKKQKECKEKLLYNFNEFKN